MSQCYRALDTLFTYSSFLFKIKNTHRDIIFFINTKLPPNSISEHISYFLQVRKTGRCSSTVEYTAANPKVSSSDVPECPPSSDRF